MKGVMFGAVAATLTIVVWLTAAILAQAELRWMIWVLGGATGIGVALGSRDHPGRSDWGVLAVLVTAVAAVVGKFAIVGPLAGTTTGPADLVYFGLATVTAFAFASGRKSREVLDAEYESAIKLAMYRVMMADGDIDEDEVATIADIYARLTHRTLSNEAILAEARQAAATGLDLLAPLVELSPYLSEDGVQTVVKAAVLVATADGRLTEAEGVLLEEIAQGVGMTQTQYEAVLREFGVEPASG